MLYIHCKYTQSAVHLKKIQLQFYRIYSNILLHNDVRLDQALNKHIHCFPRALHDLFRAVMMRWKKT